MTVYLIRHARAAERGAEYPDDSQRPLIEKGHAQAKTLAKVFETLAITLDRLFSSPYIRAAQTAEPLSTCLKHGRRVQYLEALASDDYTQLLYDLKESLEVKDEVVALVGHEPYLSELASLLLTDSQSLDTAFKKAAFMQLSGSLAPGEMTLHTFVPASVYKRVG